MSAKTALFQSAADLPVIRPDRRGYVLNDEWVDGFSDRPELPVKVRRQIAVLAQRYAPDDISDEQRTLFVARSEDRGSDMLRALSEDEADLDEAFAEGLYDSLDEQELARAREQSYPLSIGEVEALTGATARQLRHWEEQGLLRLHSFGAQRRYLRGGVLRAMALVKQEQYVLATLGKVVKEPTHLVKLIGLALRDSGDRDKISAAAREFTTIGKMLDRSVAPRGASSRSRASARLATPVRGVEHSKKATHASAFGTPKQKGKAKPKKGDVHVEPSDKGWRVAVEGVGRARSTHSTQAEAAHAARKLARKNRAELIIHGRDGRIRARNTYGHDPRPPKG
jgi:hypothetical protein